MVHLPSVLFGSFRRDCTAATYFFNWFFRTSTSRVKSLIFLLSHASRSLLDSVTCSRLFCSFCTRSRCSSRAEWRALKNKYDRCQGRIWTLREQYGGEFNYPYKSISAVTLLHCYTSRSTLGCKLNLITQIIDFRKFRGSMIFFKFRGF